MSEVCLFGIIFRAGPHKASGLTSKKKTQEHPQAHHVASSFCSFFKACWSTSMNKPSVLPRLHPNASNLPNWICLKPKPRLARQRQRMPPTFNSAHVSGRLMATKVAATSHQ